jgi:hypothetical protein
MLTTFYGFHLMYYAALPMLATAAGALLELFRDEGIDVLLKTAAVSVEGRTGDRVSLTVRGPGGPQTIEGSDLLVATGRTPKTGGIGLDIAGVALDGRATSRSMSVWRPPPPAPGRWGTAPDLLSSPTGRSTTSG